MAPGGFGKCPKCRKTLAIKSGRVEVVEPRGKCSMCCQGNKVIIERGMCDACLFGSRYALSYECNRCHRKQRIPHPMWRYCTAPDAYSSATWACHQQCGGYTHWRVVPGDLPKVPAQDRPESWGDDEWLREVRQRRQREREQSSSTLRQGHGAGRNTNSCIVM